MASVRTFLWLFAAAPIVLTPNIAAAGTAPSPSGLACGGAAVAPARFTPALAPSVARPRHVPEAGLTFSGRVTEDGAIITEARGRGLVFQKTNLPDGSIALELTAAGDLVKIELTMSGITATRNDRRAIVDFVTGSADQLDAARDMLSGSNAVRLMRRAAESLQHVANDSPAAMSLHMADALVGLLTGDDDAAGQLARQLSARSTPVHRVNVDCYGIWESRVLAASYEYDACFISFAPWNTMRNLCAYRWILQIEAYWFSMMSCIGFNRF